jgi:YVTN family beta-propeller protein
MTGSPPKLFICYRREETSAHAGRLYDAMAARFGERNVFMDIELEPGIDFVDRITEVVGACHVFLVVVGKTWATLSNGGSRPRISDKEDFVRLEVETALRRKDVRVIPLLVGGARMPHSEELPEELRALTRRNALELSDLRWRYDVGRLMGTLEGLLGTGTLPLPAAAPPAEEDLPATAPSGPTATAVPTRSAAATEQLERRDPPTTAPPLGGRPQRPRRPWLLAGIAGAAVLVLAGLAVAGVFGGSDEGNGGESGDGAPRVSATIPVGGGPDGMAVDGNVLWVTDQVENVVRRVNVKTNKTIGSPIPVGRNPDGVAAERGTAWVANIDDGTVSRLETVNDGTVRQAGKVFLGGRPEGISLGKQLVWVTTGPQGTVARIDRAQATALNPPIGMGSNTTASNTIDVLVGNHGVFVSDKFANTVTRFDSETAKKLGESTRVGNRPRGLVEGAGSVWVANSDGDSVSRISASTGRIEDTINVGDNPRDIAFADGFVWVVNTDDGTVTRINARTGSVTGKQIKVGRKPASIEAGAGSVWVSNSGDGTLTRIEP